MNKILTGVGSRETPKDILDLMTKVTKKLVLRGYTLRSGGAGGADSAFYKGYLHAKFEDSTVPTAEVYIPWEGFSDLSTRTDKSILCVKDKNILIQAEGIARDIHPVFDKLSRGAKALHTRNCFQVLGKDLQTPSTLFLCYAKIDSKGEPSGGTRTAIKIAERIGLKVSNLFVQEDLDRVLKYLNS